MAVIKSLIEKPLTDQAFMPVMYRFPAFVLLLKFFKINYVRGKDLLEVFQTGFRLYYSTKTGPVKAKDLVMDSLCLSCLIAVLHLEYSIGIKEVAPTWLELFASERFQLV